MKELNDMRVINMLHVPISQSHFNLIKAFKTIVTQGVNCLLDN